MLADISRQKFGNSGEMMFWAKVWAFIGHQLKIY
jgi:hypothetical protein